MTKVSIIVPVYNVEKYLRECLDSLVNQTLTDIEIICINDGSTDNSLAILEEYQIKDDRIKIYSQENKGVSAARNFALSKVTGEYVLFVDSDDWIKTEACEKLYNTAVQRQTDILLFSYYKFTKGNLEEDGRLLGLYEELKDNNTSFTDSTVEIFDIPFQIAGKFYKSELLLKNSVQFHTNIQHGEDRLFFISACIKSKSIGVLNEYFYFYRLDVANSLTKSGKNAIPHLFEADTNIKKIIYSTIKPDIQDSVYYIFLNKSTRAFLYFWNNCYNHLHKSENFKYLIKIKKEFRHLLKKGQLPTQEYEELKQSISEYKTLFIKKLFEPLIEIELRRNRIAIYLFEKQILNFSTLKLNTFLLKIKYFMHLFRCRLKIKSHKLRVAFWVTESEKWTSQASIYKAMEESKYFEPFVLLSYFKKQQEQISPNEHMKKNIEFFEEHNIKYSLVYKNGLFTKLQDFHPDIVFYQQPWAISSNQSVLNTSKNSLICYNPYCFHSLRSSTDYLLGFHGYLWKYFVESELHKKDYEKRFQAKNLVVSGSAKIDCYGFLDKNSKKKQEKNNDKKCIIYAPHHSFENSIHNMGTFDKNGKYILELAKSHPEFTWIFRPHPMFKKMIVESNILTLEQINNYYEEWEKIGQINNVGDYFEMFYHSDCLITDCISFLAEYLPTEKPVIHLRKDCQSEEFNKLLKTITDSYYKVYDTDSLNKIFTEVILNNNDYLKQDRINNISLLMIDETKTTGQKIVEYLKKELWIKD